MFKNFSSPYGPTWAHMGPYGPGPDPYEVEPLQDFVFYTHLYQQSSFSMQIQARENTSGLGPGPGRGPYGPIWALMFFVKNVTFRVQTAPFDKITTDFWRSRRRLYIPDLLKAKNSNVRLSFFKGVVFSSKVLRFGSRRLRLTK